MDVSRAALVALLVGLALLGSPALLLQFQDPTECANSVAPVSDADRSEAAVSTFQYDDLSPTAKRIFDQAQSVDSSVVVSGEQCPDAFSYTADQTRYEIIKNGSHYILRTYANDLVPEVAIAASMLAALGLALAGIGLATRDESNMWFPALSGAVGLATLLVVTAAVVLDQKLWLAIGWTVFVTASTLVSAGAALRLRRALILGGALALLPVIVAIPLVGLSVVVFAPAVLPLFLVGVGIAAGTLISYVQHSDRQQTA